MRADSGLTEGPVIDYLLKETSFSTCDNRFFGELEKEMLIPNNVNIYGKIRGATNLRNYILRLEFPEESSIGYIRQPSSSTISNKKRVLTYKLEDLLDYESYWWLPTDGETEFSLLLNLLPPFPNLNPVDLQISCRPDVVAGLEANVTTRIGIKAEEQIDNVYLKLAASPAYPGISMAMTKFSGDNINDTRTSITVPKKEFPFPRLSLKKGETLEYEVTTKITSNPSTMTSLRCQQDLLNTKLVLLSDSTPEGLPCAVSVIDGEGRQVEVMKTIRSTLLQANAQIMYSPFSLRKEAIPERSQTVAAVTAQ